MLLFKITYNDVWSLVATKTTIGMSIANRLRMRLRLLILFKQDEMHPKSGTGLTKFKNQPADTQWETVLDLQQNIRNHDIMQMLLQPY